MADPKSEAARQLLSKLWSQTQAQAGKAARYGRDVLSLRQLRADRERLFVKLGKEVRQLVEAGDVDHPGLAKGVARIKEIELRIRAAEDAMRAKGLEPESEAQSAEAHANPGDEAG
jgi:hypothetical protein